MEITSVYPSTIYTQFSLAIAFFAWKMPYSSRSLWYISESEELMYFCCTPFVRESRSRPPKALTLPLTPIHGNITLPEYLSTSSPLSRLKHSPVAMRYFSLNPLRRASCARALRDGRAKPRWNFSIMSSRKPRLRKYCMPTALPSTSLRRMLLKYSIAHLLTMNMLSRSFCSRFSSSLISRSCTSMLYLLASHFSASTYVICSCSMRKLTGFADFPHEKQWQIPRAGET